MEENTQLYEEQSSFFIITFFLRRQPNKKVNVSSIESQKIVLDIIVGLILVYFRNTFDFHFNVNNMLKGKKVRERFSLSNAARLRDTSCRLGAPREDEVLWPITCSTASRLRSAWANWRGETTVMLPPLRVTDVAQRVLAAALWLGCEGNPAGPLKHDRDRTEPNHTEPRGAVSFRLLMCVC